VGGDRGWCLCYLDGVGGGVHYSHGLGVLDLDQVIVETSIVRVALTVYC
jgi:hypothetical protein